MIATGRLQHIRNQLGRDGRPGLVLLVLPCVREVRNDGRDTSSAGCFACVDHDEELHQAVIDLAWGGGLEYEDYGKASVYWPGPKG